MFRKQVQKLSIYPRFKQTPVRKYFQNQKIVLSLGAYQTTIFNTVKGKVKKKNKANPRFV